MSTKNFFKNELKKIRGYVVIVFQIIRVNLQLLIVYSFLSLLFFIR